MTPDPSQCFRPKPRPSDDIGYFYTEVNSLKDRVTVEIHTYITEQERAIWLVSDSLPRVCVALDTGRTMLGEVSGWDAIVCIGKSPGPLD